MQIQLSDDSLLRVLQSLIAHELGRSRRLGAVDFNNASWGPETSITPSPSSGEGDSEAASINADSLELISLATAVTSLFQLHRIGLEDYLLRYRTLGQWVEVIQTSRGRGEMDVGFQTSGSTGTPKLIGHRWEALETEIVHFHSVLRDSLQFQPTRLVVPVPSHHIYGFLFGAVMADRLRLPVICGTHAMTLMMRGGLDAGDLVVGNPFFWQQVVKAGRELPSGVLGLTSTGPSEPALWDSLYALGLTGLLEIYGSTETAGIGWRSAHADAFTLLPRWQRAENEFSLLDRDQGELFSLPDEVRWEGERHLRPTRRRDRAVQVGGVNVYPDRVAWHLERLDFVARAQVELSLEEGGGRLRAVIVPVAGAPSPEDMTSQLRAWCARQLSSPERPAVFSFSGAD